MKPLGAYHAGMVQPFPIGRVMRAAAVAAAAACLGGCAVRGEDLGYYWQSLGGHWSLLRAARPVDDWLADPATAQPLRGQLLLAQRLRDFAVRELALPDNSAYRRYADLGRPAAVWNVVAAPELGLSLKTWCFPLLGCVGYRGYFDRAQANALADRLRAQGWEVAVYGVPAYSTLGKLPGSYLADPLLNTFIGWPELDLARLIFHELAHQVAYAPDDTAFNESFATAVERLGSRQWLASGEASAGAGEASERAESRRRAFRELVTRARAELQAVYGSDRTDEAKRAAKADVLARLRERHAALKAGPWAGYAGYDEWIREANNARLAVQGAYHDRVDAFEALFESQGRRWPDFLMEARRLAQQPKAQRDQTLATLEARRRDGQPVAPAH